MRDPGDVVTIRAATPEETLTVGMSYPNYRDLRERSRSFDGLVAYRRQSAVSFARTSRDAREMRVGMLVSDNFFDVLGVQPALGRGFVPDEGLVPGRDAVVVLSHDFWSNVLAADASIVNAVVHINGIDFTVIGVAPSSFTGIEPTIRPALYLPMMMTQRLDGVPESPLDDRADRRFIVKGRLASGVSRREAEAELQTVWVGLGRAYPDANRNRRLTVLSEPEFRTLAESITASFVARQMWLVAIVLVVACANP